MNSNGLIGDLVKFFKAAKHLWGRCPHCREYFRMSDVSLSSSPNPPKDWLRRLEKQQFQLAEKEERLSDWQTELEEQNENLQESERELRQKEKYLERDARERVKDMLKSDPAMQRMIREAKRDAVQRSRATLLGKLLERVAPCFRKFAYDPRDMRCICDPVDYVLFDGLTTERSVREITFIEVKCGRSRLTSVQRSVREAIEKGRIRTELWEIGDPDIAITKQLSTGYDLLPVLGPIIMRELPGCAPLGAGLRRAVMTSSPS